MQVDHLLAVPESIERSVNIESDSSSRDAVVSWRSIHDSPETPNHRSGAATQAINQAYLAGRFLYPQQQPKTNTLIPTYFSFLVTSIQCPVVEKVVKVSVKVVPSDTGKYFVITSSKYSSPTLSINNL